MKSIILREPPRPLPPAIDTPLQTAGTMLIGMVAVLIALGLPIWAHWWVTH